MSAFAKAEMQRKRAEATLTSVGKLVGSEVGLNEGETVGVSVGVCRENGHVT